MIGETAPVLLALRNVTPKYALLSTFDRDDMFAGGMRSNQMCLVATWAPCLLEAMRKVTPKYALLSTIGSDDNEGEA